MRCGWLVLFVGCRWDSAEGQEAVLFELGFVFGQGPFSTRQLSLPVSLLSSLYSGCCSWPMSSFVRAAPILAYFWRAGAPGRGELALDCGGGRIVVLVVVQTLAIFCCEFSLRKSDNCRPNLARLFISHSQTTSVFHPAAASCAVCGIAFNILG